MVGDWIRLHRKIIDSAVFQHGGLLKLWVYCLLRANWKDKDILLPGTTVQVALKRGQFLTGRRALHKALYPDVDSEGLPIHHDNKPSESTVWRWLENLELAGQIKIASEPKFSVVTICNYDTYQNDPSDNEPMVNQSRTNGEPMVNQSRTNGEPMVNQSCTDREPIVNTEEEGKKDKKEKKERKKEDSSIVENPTTEPPTPAVLVFPTNGPRKTWELTQSQIDAWAQLYNDIDVMGECRKALAWVQANNRKTATGMTRFLVGWLNRANDSTQTARASPANDKRVALNAARERLRAWAESESANGASET